MSNKLKKSFSFLDNCICTVCGKFSLEQTEYLLLALNVLTDTPKILDITNGDIFQLNLCQCDKKYDKSVAMPILAVFGTL